MSYSTILFDFDGTLIPSLELWLQAFQYAFAQFNKTIPDQTIIERCFYRSFGEVVSEFELGDPNQFKEFVYTGLWLYFEKADLCLGAREILEYCQTQKIKMGVVTSSPRKTVERALKSLDAFEFFKHIVTADDVTNFKPHPEPVLLALEHLNSQPSECLFVGDSVSDILAGHAAGTSTALFFSEAHQPFHNFTELTETKPHFIFEHYHELATYLNKAKLAL